jgi:hypothetical protein
VALAVATAIALLLCASLVEPKFRPTVYRALAGDLAIPVVAWFVIKAIHKRRRA